MTVLITGANRGIGRALLTRYESRGETAFGTARIGTPYLPLDVTKPGDFHALKSAVGNQPIDLLICNAGVYLDKGQELNTGFEAADWATTFAANVTGVFQTIQSLLPNLRAAPAANIAIISSQMASQTLAPGGSYIYRASKAAALNLGRNLATDLRGEGIAVGVYHPGWVKTDMGGSEADITLDQSADGLVARFDELSLATTGCFRTWDGADHPY